MDPSSRMVVRGVGRKFGSQSAEATALGLRSVGTGTGTAEVVEAIGDGLCWLTMGWMVDDWWTWMDHFAARSGKLGK